MTTRTSTPTSNRSGTIRGDRLLRRIDILIDQLTKRGQGILMREFRREVGRGPIATTLTHLRNGKPITSDLIARIDKLEMDEDRLREIYTHAFDKGGRATSSVYENLVAFNPSHPRVVEWGRTSAASKVQEISMTTREGLRGLISNAMQQGLTPRALADQLKSSVGLTFRQTQLVEDYRQRMFGRGISSARANATAAHYAQSLLSQRVNAIAETEIAASVEAGKQEYWLQAQDAGLIGDGARKIWIIENDDRVDEMCSVMAFQEADIKGYFNTPIGPQQYPPIHPHCRCQTILESEEANTHSVRASLSTLGGFTTHVVSGQTPPDGWMVAVPGRESVRAFGAVNEDWINEYKRANRDLLEQSGHFWGGWVEQTSSGRNVYLDISKNVKGMDDAIALGNTFKQKAIYNLATGETLDLGTMTISKAKRTLVAMVIPGNWSGARIRQELSVIVARYLE